MKFIAVTDFLVGVGMLLVLEGLLFAGFPEAMRKAMKSAMTSPDNMLRIIGLVSAVAGLLLIWLMRRS
jgi:uncharacterized protein YjeT (DUF2065 family)